MDQLQTQLKDIAIGYEDETSLVGRIGEVLLKRPNIKSLAESCTGGAIAEEITQHAGVSSFYRKYYSLCYRAKTSILGVDAQLIAKYNVVSNPVAEAMAQRSNVLLKRIMPLPPPE